MLDAYASGRHYWEHLEPIWRALPEHLRGTVWTARASDPWGTRYQPTAPPYPVLVAHSADARKMAGRPKVYVEHGAGQCYLGDPGGLSSSYAGGPGHNDTLLFVAPSEAVADRWRTTYPATPVAVVGCPKLDPWHSMRNAYSASSAGPVVAVTFHWNNPLVPESLSALHHYQAHLGALVAAVAAAGGTVVGHAHPRAEQRLRDVWGRLGVPYVPNLGDVFDRADLLVADNTSAMYEFASLDRPVLTLNSPWYRRDVHHGLRFWSHVPGLQVDHPADLPDAVLAALADPPEARALRQRAVAHVYAHTDGHAAQRAADAIVEVLP